MHLPCLRVTTCSQHPEDGYIIGGFLRLYARNPVLLWPREQAAGRQVGKKELFLSHIYPY